MALGWRPTVDVKALAVMMVEDDFELACREKTCVMQVMMCRMLRGITSECKSVSAYLSVPKYSTTSRTSRGVRTVPMAGMELIGPKPCATCSLGSIRLASKPFRS